MSEPGSQAFVTFVHGTWASAAPWTRPDSELCRALHQTAEQIGVRIEFRTHGWSGRNRVREREEAARGLEHRLREDFERSPGASHFLIAHSHGGNIVLDAIHSDGMVGRLSGIVTLSTPFVSCRRSGIRVAGVVLAILAFTVCAVWVMGLILQALWWIQYQAYSHLSPGWLLGAVNILLGFMFMAWFIAFFINLPIDLLRECPNIWDSIGRSQDAVLQRFDRSLQHPVAMLCVRFRMDEALVALSVARLLVKPVRILTISLAYVGAIGGFLYLITIPLGFLGGTLDALLMIVLGPDNKLSPGLRSGYMAVLSATWELLKAGILPAIVLATVWLALGYIMSSLTLGHWGGIIDQLLVDFRITGAPDGASAVTKIYSPWRWRRTLLHSLAYSDRRALGDICDWLAARMREGKKNRWDAQS